MKRYSFMIPLLLLSSYLTLSQEGSPLYKKSSENTLKQLMIYDNLIGDCSCKSLRRGPQGQWQDTVDLKWKWSYIMDGKGVKDEGWYISNTKKHHFTSIRVYDTLHQHWYVSYFTPDLQSKPETWIGGIQGTHIVLKKDQETPQGLMQSILTFSNISEKGFHWEGKIVNAEKKINYPFWKIWCLKEE
ncbi:hypothetical protein [Spongiimicrobium salis]|uniref:hypothetical protein n=1 Tax=Spongiimicrobium salis TaxID=1667022 RepID=UPI00374D4B54